MKEKTLDGLRATIDEERNARAIAIAQRDRMARHLVAIAKRLGEGKGQADIELVRLYSHRTVQDALDTIEILYGPNGPPQPVRKTAQQSSIFKDQDGDRDGEEIA